MRKLYGDESGMGFTIALHKHHCHGEGRFKPTVICGDCNSADGAAKRKLKLPPNVEFLSRGDRALCQRGAAFGATNHRL
jgi:hypothetical protein